MDKETESFANVCEAGAFNINPSEIPEQSFSRSGAAAGVLDAATAVAELSKHVDVVSRASREWGKEVDFIAPSDISCGVGAVAMRYLSDEDGRPRKRAHRGGESTRSSKDGPNQPRYVRLHRPIRGMELDDDALTALDDKDEYMQRIRMPHQDQAGRCLLTLRYLNYGSNVLSDGDSVNPLWAAATTWLRVASESNDFSSACRYMAAGTRTSCVCEDLAVHVDGASTWNRRGPPPTSELVTTRWAAAARDWSHERCMRELEAARESQPLVGMSLWLRSSVALDVAPCSGLALVAGTASEHGVSQPLPSSAGLDVERGGFTRAFAQSCRPDDCLDDLAFIALVRRRGHMLTRRQAEREPFTAGSEPLRAAGQGQSDRGQGIGHHLRRDPAQIQRYVPGDDNQSLLPYFQHHPAPPQGWARAPRNRRPGRTY